jgi:hypothetical protein
MTWDRSQGVNPKYRSREHRLYLARLKEQLKRQGYLICTADPCYFPGRLITNPYGRHPDGLTAGHQPNGIDYAGPQHHRCNVKDGARRGRERKRNASLRTNLRW